MKWILMIFLGLSCSLAAQNDTFMQDCRARDTLWFSSKLIPTFRKINKSKVAMTPLVTRIIQIGDSHVQMGWFSSAISSELNTIYGNTATDMFWFPYSVAGGYDPAGVRFTRSGSWTGEKMVGSKTEKRFGISGHALVLNERGAEDPFFTVDQDASLKTLEVLVVTNKTWKFCVDSAVVTTKKITGNLSLVTIKRTSKEKILKVGLCPVGKVQVPLRILGFRNATNPKVNGIDFQYYGSSGGRYSDYIDGCHYFFENLAYLKPDLLIISLGTNDTYVHGLTNENYYAMVSRFVKELKKQHPNMDILLTMPPDTAFKNTKPESAKVVFMTLFRIAQENNCALWNFAEVMGGKDSIQTWFTKGLANPDLMHLNERGYAVQGQLLVEALNKAYLKYFK